MMIMDNDDVVNKYTNQRTMNAHCEVALLIFNGIVYRHKFNLDRGHRRTAPAFPPEDELHYY